MKGRGVRFKSVAAVLLGAGLLTFLGCDSGGGGGVTGFMTLSVDGSGKSYTDVAGGEILGIASVAGVNPYSMYPWVGVTFPPGVGSYSSSSSDGGSLQWYPDSSTMYMATDGSGSYSITITSYGPIGGWITGTFSGTLPKAGGTGSVTISGGSFNATRLY